MAPNPYEPPRPLKEASDRDRKDSQALISVITMTVTSVMVGLAGRYLFWTGDRIIDARHFAYGGLVGLVIYLLTRATSAIYVYFTTLKRNR
jgi:hypothetical protein